MTARNATRREQNRQNTLAEIKQHARQQMAQQGTAALSLRSIAAAMGMAVSALYRYYASRDDLITALLVDAFGALGDFMWEAHDARPLDPTVRVLAASLAYRDWALANRLEFQLIFGNPIPGYHCPPELTVPLVWRAFSAIMKPIEDAIQAGLFQPASAYLAGDTPLGREFVAASERVPQFSPAALSVSAALYAVGHGAIMLELYEHIQPLIGDQAAAFYRRELIECLKRTGWDSKALQDTQGE